MNTTYIHKNAERFLDELKTFLSIPSVSAVSAHEPDMETAANFLMMQMQEAGLDQTKKIYSGGKPLVYGEKFIHSHLPTVLIYGHYDVQPAEPLELWESLPFSPEIRKGNIYARGACDDKAQVHLIIKAIEAMKHTEGFPCNIKFMIEGEEEIGSLTLENFILENADMLQADSFLVCDTSMPSANQPQLITGLRGICYWELEIETAEKDLHSGMHGGCALNAANVLSRLIGKMQNEAGEILIPGFYDGTDTPSTASGIHALSSLDVNGFNAGYTGEGPKTVIPAKATAKISSRLAPGQCHKKVHEAFFHFISDNLPAGAKFTLKKLAGCNAVTTHTDTPDYLSAEEALSHVFGTRPADKKIGGSIPVVSLVQEHLKLNPVLMGFGLDTDQIHAPNEHFSIDQYFKGIETLLLFFTRYAQLHTEQHKKNTIIHH